MDLAVLRDVFPRAIRGWPRGRRREPELTITARGRAFERGRPEIPPSDPGVPSPAHASVARLIAAGAPISRARVANPERREMSNV